MFPYKLKTVRQIQAHDYGARRTFAALYIENLELGHNFLSRIIFPMIVSFTSAGNSTSITFEYGGTERRQETQEMNIVALKSLSGVPCQGDR